MKFNIAIPFLGFDDIKEVSLEKVDDVFMKMQSIDNDNISFTLVDPFVLRFFLSKLQVLLLSIDFYF